MDKNIYNIGLHEMITVAISPVTGGFCNTYDIQRVAGGFIYKKLTDKGSGVFVPFNDEFLSKEKFERQTT